MDLTLATFLNIWAHVSSLVSLALRLRLSQTLPLLSFKKQTHTQTDTPTLDPQKYPETVVGPQRPRLAPALAVSMEWSVSSCSSRKISGSGF